MKRFLLVSLALCFTLAFSACGKGNASEADIQTADELAVQDGQSNANPALIYKMTEEEARVTPEIRIYGYEEAAKMTDMTEMRGILPGLSEGVWYTARIDGVEYYYGRYDDTPDKTDFWNYAIVSSEYALGNGICVGMGEEGIFKICPNAAILNTDGETQNQVTGHMGWNGTTYPRGTSQDARAWAEQFDSIVLSDVEKEGDTTPRYVAFMIKDKKVAAITFYGPTEG